MAVIALPIGMWLGHIHRGSFIAINLGNVWRALPSLAVLAIGVALLGIGLKNVELALIVLAVPPMITNAYVAIDGVDRETVDAARGMGLTEWQIVRQVEVPMGIPLIFAGIRTASLFVISTTTIASAKPFTFRAAGRPVHSLAARLYRLDAGPSVQTLGPLSRALLSALASAPPARGDRSCATPAPRSRGDTVRLRAGSCRG